MEVLQGTFYCISRRHIHRSLQKAELAYQALNLYRQADPYLTPFRNHLSTLSAQARPLLLPILNRTAVFAQESPALISVGVLLLFLLIAVQILSFAKRILIWWFRLAVWIVFYGLFAVLLAVVWQRGVGRTVEDLVGFGAHLNEYWWREYEKWEGYQNQAAKAGGTKMAGTRAGNAWR
jgi:hypothetical protein